MIELIKFNEVTGEVGLNHDSVALYPCIGNILRKDTSAGRTRSWSDIGYAYITSDYRSIPNQKGYTKKEAHIFAINTLKLKPTYEPSEDVVELMEFITKEQHSTALEIYQALNKGLHSTSRVLDKLNHEIDLILLKDECIGADKELMFTILDKILKLSGDIPNKIEAIQSAEEAMKKSQDVSKKRKGGEVILDSMNPA